MLPSVRASRTLRSAIPGRTRLLSTASADKYKIVVVGAGIGGLAVAHQLYDRFKAAGQSLNDGDIAIVDAAEYHYYQPGWTLVGSGLKSKLETRRPVASLIPNKFTHIPEYVKDFVPTSSSVTTTSGRSVSYDFLVVAAGIQVDWNRVEGLTSALSDPSSGVCSNYSYNSCDKTWGEIEAIRSGNAVFTQPSGGIKCAGAPQKIMWMAWDRFRRTSRGNNINVNFYTGMPTMFSVKKYSDALNDLRKERNIGGYFEHDLIRVDANNHKAVFKTKDGKTTDVDYTMLHVTPPMSAPEFIKKSPIADEAGWVKVDPATLRHVDPRFGNIFSLGDCSSCPTSKTAAAAIYQAPVLTENLFSVATTGDVHKSACYHGETGCPLLTGYGELMLCEFKYGQVPQETFAPWLGDQRTRRRLFYHLKKDLFPFAHWNYMTKGRWFGKTGILRPSFD